MIKVFRLKDLIKYFLCFIIPIILIVILINFIGKKKAINSGNEINKNETAIESTKTLLEAKKNTKLKNLNKKYTNNTLKSKLSTIFARNKKVSTNVNNNETIEVSANSTNTENKSPYYFCLDSEIINLNEVKDETKINFVNLIKTVLNSEFGILKQANFEKEDSSKSEANETKMQKAFEYSLGLKPVWSEENSRKGNEVQDNNENGESENSNNDVNNTSNVSSNNQNNTSSTENDNTNSSADAENITQAEENVKTEVPDGSKNARYNFESNGIKIYNSSKYTLTDEMIDVSNYSVNKNKVLIYHTHTCESYTPTEKFSYTQTGNFRTTDLNFSVVRVGEELKKQLESYNIKVIQSKNYHDYPSYNGSYSRSLETAKNMLAENQDAEIVIDLHRDAIADSSFAPKVKIGDAYVSQLMFVIGTDASNPENSNWNENLKFAVKVQKIANEMYPGLFKPIILRNSEYNQHIAKAACIIEVGATGNTLEESIGAMKYLAKVISKL